ncbi:GNAT family N-acetyltransferase [Marinoscillum sp. MHG1-6]|uniref:GNAT family N-acetyltransferase n=1 Tax=Marinoscillum sp. MHG1-6 TaxID=2959627 RepID=UPI002157D425|nr:GNAT family N-acetyltransferase [Marinoscillum sp. MHG1-6]
MSILVKVILATTGEQKQLAFAVRQEVFVVEQHVSREDEFDQYEEQASHFLAYAANEPIGAARWRKTDKGIKLERFAVKKSFRGMGVGSEILQAVLDDIKASSESGQYLYLHAQLPAIPLYEKFGFEKTGPQFEECDILHYKMEMVI